MVFDAQNSAGITGGDAGISSTVTADGTTTVITTTGVVAGGGSGIYASNAGTGGLTITSSNSGADLVTRSTSGIYASNTRVNTGATLSGVMSLGDGSVIMTIADATITSVTVFNGGDDSDAGDGFIDMLRFSGFNGSFSADPINWEEVVFAASVAEVSGAAITAPDRFHARCAADGRCLLQL
ncbi:MAG: hypothetical protein AAF280_10555 [Pseudomonadota bacterium]